MRGRHGGGQAPEIAPADIEGGSRAVSMTGAGGRPLIQPFQGVGAGAYDNADGKSKGRRSTANIDGDTFRMVGMACGGIWVVGWLLLGYDLLWPFYFVVDTLFNVLSFPPFSWIFGWFYRGAPLLSGHAQQLAEEMQLPGNQVGTYMDSYVNQYGDAALIFAAHDGYPQIVKGLLQSAELGYRDLLDARDDGGNTALIYAAAKGFKQTTATLLRMGADPDLANTGSGGRTALMEAAGAGYREIVNALRLTPNITIDMQDDYGNTALHYGAYHGNLAVVLELLKSNPNKAIQNIYGHTAASYAESNKQKAVVDALTRAGPSRAQRLQEDAEQAQKKRSEDIQKALQEQLKNALANGQGKQEEDAEQTQKKRTEDIQKALQEQLQKALGKSQDKHVKGSAENLHKDGDDDFAPKLDEKNKGVSEAERAALEEQLSKLRRAHEEAELKAQKKIVDLLEKSSEQQRVIDEAESTQRAARMNHTELSFKLSELESKHRSSELRADEEASRAASFQTRHETARLEAESHQRRAEAAERERDEHHKAVQRHQESLQRVQDEIRGHLDRHESQNKELADLRAQIDRMDAERRLHADRVDELERELRRQGHDVEKIAQSGFSSA